MSHQIYLDNNATTALDPCVAECFFAAATAGGNASSSHTLGRQARQALVAARDVVAAFLGAFSEEILFTSSATEGLNFLLRGLFPCDIGGHIITTALEHAAVYETVQALTAQHHCSATFVPVGASGAVDPAAIEGAITSATRLIAIMAANNETGVKNDIFAIAAIAERHGIPLVVDAVALVGKESMSIPAGVSALCFSGHKIHAPQGVAAVFIRRTLKPGLVPLITGGGQERGLRGGTENIAAIVAMAKAVELLQQELPAAQSRMKLLRDSLERQLIERFPAVVTVNGGGSQRLVNTSNLAFHGVDGESLLFALDRQGIIVSLGAACASGAIEPSRVLRAMGLPLAVVRSSLRFSLSRMTMQDEVDRTVDVISGLIK